MGNINHIKAYLLGLLVGSGKVDENTFVIDLPFKKWGMDPERMNIIAIDILTKICQYFNSSYNFNVTYEIVNGKWLILPMKNSDISILKKDLEFLGLPYGGFLLSTVDLSTAKIILKGENIGSFLSGIFDARASLTLSHRRFTDDAPVVSVEIPGSTQNFKFVVQLCAWLTDLGSITDQILYNHPNQHSASDPGYTNWKKGFKIRFLVSSFLTRYSFALQAKSQDVTHIHKNQKKVEQIPCILRKLGAPSPVSVHIDQNSNELPDSVRGKLFFHYHHFCAILGCHHAPVNEIKKLVETKNKFINFFPRLSKGTINDLMKTFEYINVEYFPHLKISNHKIKVSEFLRHCDFKGFDGARQGIAYLFADFLKGKRHSGSMEEIINKHINDILCVKAIGETFNSPLLVVNPVNDRAFICSSVENELNQKLINTRIVSKNLDVYLSDKERD